MSNMPPQTRAEMPAPTVAQRPKAKAPGLFSGAAAVRHWRVGICRDGPDLHPADVDFFVAVVVSGKLAGSGSMTMAVYTGRGSRFSPVLMPVMALLLATSCSTAVSAQRSAPGMFAGKWSYAKTCDSGHYVNLILNQRGGHVCGEWSAGTDIRGGDGRLDGKVRGGRLYVRYCSTDGEEGYEVCPRLGSEEDYFELKDGVLQRFVKSGSTYRHDISLHPEVPGRPAPVRNEGCDHAGRE